MTYLNEWTIDSFKGMEAEKYYDNPCPKTDALNRHKQDILDNKDDKYIATEKNDGCWAMLIHKTKGDNLIRSRSLSKVTGTYGDFTAHLPHIVNEMDELPDNTCLIGEICWNQRGKTSNDVDVILHCLSEKAVARQEEIGKLHVVVFDCLMIDSRSYQIRGYEFRLYAAYKLLNKLGLNYIHTTNVYLSNFREEAEKIWSEGGEGLVIQDRQGFYEPGKRTSWKTLKYKLTMDSFEVPVIGTVDANKEYEGKELDTWKYFDEDGTPVTKAYYNGWKTAIVVQVNGVQCKVSSGLTELDQQFLATKEAEELIKENRLYAEIKAMMVNSKDSLRHPSVVRLRSDVV